MIMLKLIMRDWFSCKRKNDLNKYTRLKYILKGYLLDTITFINHVPAE